MIALAEYEKLVREKALQNLSTQKKDIWDILIENPEEVFSILTLESLVGGRDLELLSAYFTSGYALAMFKDNDLEFIANCIGLSNIEQLFDVARDPETFMQLLAAYEKLVAAENETGQSYSSKVKTSDISLLSSAIANEWNGNLFYQQI